MSYLFISSLSLNLWVFPFSFTTVLIYSFSSWPLNFISLLCSLRGAKEFPLLAFCFFSYCFQLKVFFYGCIIYICLLHCPCKILSNLRFLTFLWSVLITAFKTVFGYFPSPPFVYSSNFPYLCLPSLNPFIICPFLLHLKSLNYQLYSPPYVSHF